MGEAGPVWAQQVRIPLNTLSQNCQRICALANMQRSSDNTPAVID
jgi:hypothetical protein